MSQLILDEQVDLLTVLPALRRWAKVNTLSQLRPDEHILDDRVPAILGKLTQPTFVTIDADFWDRRLCHTAYCILYFALRLDEQGQLSGLLRALFRRPEFRTRKVRMGKVARVSNVAIDYWQHGSSELHHIDWTGVSPRRRR